MPEIESENWTKIRQADLVKDPIQKKSMESVENSLFSPRIALNHQYRYRIENSDTWSAEFRRGMHGMQPTWSHYCSRSEENKDRRQEGCNNSGLLSDPKGRAVHSISFEPVSSHRWRIMVNRPLIKTGCYASGRRPKMNRPSLPWQETRFKSCKLNHGKFRLNKLSHPTRFRPRISVYGKRKLRQQQPGFSILSRRPLRFRVRNRTREEKCKLNHSYRIRSEYSDIQIPEFRQHVRGIGRSEARAIINSGIVADRTGELRATIDEINCGDLMSQVQSQCSSGDISSLSPNGECEKGEVKEQEVEHNYSFHADGERRLKSNDKQVIELQLLDTESSAGAQQHKMSKDRLKDRICISSGVQMTEEDQPSCHGDEVMSGSSL